MYRYYLHYFHIFFQKKNTHCLHIFFSQIFSSNRFENFLIAAQLTHFSCTHFKEKPSFFPTQLFPPNIFTMDTFSLPGTHGNLQNCGFRFLSIISEDNKILHLFQFEVPPPVSVWSWPCRNLHGFRWLFVRARLFFIDPPKVGCIFSSRSVNSDVLCFKNKTQNFGHITMFVEIGNTQSIWASKFTPDVSDRPLAGKIQCATNSRKVFTRKFNYVSHLISCVSLTLSVDSTQSSWVSPFTIVLSSRPISDKIICAINPRNVLMVFNHVVCLTFLVVSGLIRVTFVGLSDCPSLIGFLWTPFTRILCL